MQEQVQTTTALAPPTPFGLVGKNETASSAVAAQAQAAVQARYVMAYQRPRNFDQVRLDMLKECRRPAFAEVARYHKPIGAGVEGPSIRFAEAAARCMGNILVESPTVYDDASKRIVRVTATDLEANVTYQKDVTVTKTVERRNLAKGQAPISTRVGSGGHTLYIVEADDDAILNKESALVSKAMRTVLLRFIPGDLIDEAMEQVYATLQNKAAEDPEAARKRMVDAFAAVGVHPTDLVAYLKHDLSKTTPSELVKLRSLHQSIRDGETTWVEVMGNEARETPTDGKTQTQRTSEMLDQKRTAAAQAKPVETSPAQAQASEPPHDPKTGEVKQATTTPSAKASTNPRRGQAPQSAEPHTTRGTFETDAEMLDRQAREARDAMKNEPPPHTDGDREPGED